MLERLIQQLREARDRLSALMDISDRELTDDEQRSYEALVASADEDGSVRSLERRVRTAQEAREAATRAQAVLVATDGTEQRASDPVTPSGVRIGSEPTTYRRPSEGGRESYFRDLTAVSLNRSGYAQAMERLERSSRETEVLMQERALSTTDGAGGEFVPPLWMIDQFVELARAGRVTADLVNKQTLPGGTDSLNIPKIATGTAVAAQATQNTAVQNTDLTTTSVQAGVETIAGQQVLSVQLIEQSPINWDEIILEDLSLDYAVKVDTFVLNNNAAGKRGIFNTTGINSVVYTDATPTVGEIYPKGADAVQQVHTLRLLPPTHVIMHPRRWGWFTAALDAGGRPLVVPEGNGPNNAAIVQTAVESEGGPVGKWHMIPVHLDPNIPTNFGTNEDRIIIGRMRDAILWEGSPKAEAFRETKADQLSVLFRFYNYAVFSAERFPKSFSVISGTGLIAPTF